MSFSCTVHVHVYSLELTGALFLAISTVHFWTRVLRKWERRAWYSMCDVQCVCVCVCVHVLLCACVCMCACVRACVCVIT